MKLTLTTHEVAHRIHADEYAGFSHAGALALAKHLEEMETDLGEEMELDTVAIRCGYAEYDSLVDFAEMYFGNASNVIEILGSESEEAAREFIYGQSATLLEFSGGVIASNF